MRRPDRHRVGADAEEAGVPEAHLAGETHQQIEAEHGEREDEHQRGDAEIERRRQHQRQQEHERRNGEYSAMPTDLKAGHGSGSGF